MNTGAPTAATQRFRLRSSSICGPSPQAVYCGQWQGFPSPWKRKPEKPFPRKPPGRENPLFGRVSRRRKDCTANVR